ncbi:hypothetical protein [Aulosira sp. FACHB-615]|uniref:hypothetical protein n=1 Tax=Aulosira sp. FACHB-615 TaxID=2692777 RepID=UPI001683A626|nr:hypothetical protein [Aulosira sp. FACHB-615]MBD2492530.1 hypothetical protein [Aulosira sp. FACHB-615]
MKSEAFVIVVLIVALLVVVELVVKAIAPVVQHCWAKYQHHRMIEVRREQFYRELGMLMRD